MATNNLKDGIIQIAKQFFLRAGYTVLKGNVRQSIRESGADAAPPAHLLANARVCADRYQVLHQLPVGGTAVEVGVAYGDFTRHILDVLKPDHFIAIDIFGIVPDDEPWGRQHLKDNHCSHYDY